MLWEEEGGWERLQDPLVLSFHCSDKLGQVCSYFQGDASASGRCSLASFAAGVCTTCRAVHSTASVVRLVTISCSCAASVRLLGVRRLILAVDTMQRGVFFPALIKQLSLICSQPQRGFSSYPGSGTGSSTDNSHYGQDKRPVCAPLCPSCLPSPKPQMKFQVREGIILPPLRKRDYRESHFQPKIYLITVSPGCL